MFKKLITITTLIYSGNIIAEDEFFKTRTETRIIQFDDQYLDKELPINKKFLESYDKNIKLSNNLSYKLDLEKMEIKLFKDVDQLNKLKLLVPYKVEENSHLIGRYALVICPIYEKKTTTSYEKPEDFKVDGSRISSRKLNFDTITSRVMEPGYYRLSGNPKKKTIMTKLVNGNIFPFNNHPVTSEFIILCQNIELELIQYEIKKLRDRIDQQHKDTEMKKLGIKY